MYYKESFDLITCKERKVQALLLELTNREDKDIGDLFNKFMCEYEYKEINMDDFSSELSAILAQYGKLRNNVIDYYYPESETKSYEDAYGSGSDDE